MKYRRAEIPIPATSLLEADPEWQELPDGERVIHVLGDGRSTGRYVVVIEKSKDNEDR